MTQTSTADVRTPSPAPGSAPGSSIPGGPPGSLGAQAPTISLTINGRCVSARHGQTVLQAAASVGIDIPTLCHHPAISPHGGCRVCLVEIEKQRALQPACTFPVAEGLSILTESPRVVAGRRYVLEMLFSERPHYCMICPVSGGEHTSECELQKLAYRYGLDCWSHKPDTSVRWALDATRPHFIMDHSRCILCRRCVRACSELAASHTLGVQNRGTRTMICADDAVPFAESSCVSCGTCLQICPTGALMDRRSAFMGHEVDAQRTRTTCVGCAVGCTIDTLVRDGELLRVEGVWDSPNRGVLCSTGRFEVLDDPPPRLRKPIIRRDGKHVECSWDEALTAVAENLKKAASIAGLITARSTNQSLFAFSRMFRDIFRSDQVGLLSGQTPPLGIGKPGSMIDIHTADCIVVLGGDPMKHQKVLAYLIRQAVDHGSRLIVANAAETELEPIADVVIRLQDELVPGRPALHARIAHLRPDRMAQVRLEVETAQRPVILYGEDLDDQICNTLRMLPDRARFLPLVDGPNAVGAANLGLTVKPVRGDALYVVASDELPGECNAQLPEAKFLAVQASFHSDWTRRADVALPSKVWFEKTGHLTSIDGHRVAMTRSLEASRDVLNDWTAMFLLSVKMGQPLTCISVAEAASAR